jgi:transcriptional regulator with PAS, ATPase and Fis domain/CHASE2 domain-containing sensor protein
MSHATRWFFSTLWLQAVTTAIAATALSALVWSLAPALYTSLDWALYDAWMKSRNAPDSSPDMLVVVRDDAAEAQLGSGLWDRSVVARAIFALHDAGATRIGIDIPLDRPSPPNMGGAVSDALLLEAIKSAGPVVYPVYPQSWAGSEPMWLPLGEASSAGAAAILPQADEDRVVRRLRLSERLGAADLPAFGWQLAVNGEQSRTVRLPTNSGGPVLINFIGNGTASAFRSMGFLDLTRLLDDKHDEELQDLVKDKIVVLLVRPRLFPGHVIPLGIEISEALLQLHFTHTLLTGHWIRPLPAVGRVLVSLLVAIGLAYLTLRQPDSKGWLLGVGVLAAYVLLVLAALLTLQWVFPVALPLSGSLLALLTSSLLGQSIAARRVRLLERDMLHVQQDLSAVREALVCRETAVESLEEDLESARMQASQSAYKEAELLKTTGDLHHRILEAQRQEELTRRRIEELERELGTLRHAAGSAGPLDDTEQEALRRECEQFGIITRHPRLLATFRDLKKGARSAVTVLITGEPGTGKELFARAVHRLSPRAAKPFVAVNMAAISPELFESELFGHMRGSFSGAVADRKGFFELAHQGTIFLDEIGDLRLDHQSKLLRVLQDKTFYRVGAATPTTVDVRIVAATNKDLQRGVSEGWFREDLYFRLKGLVLTLVPLRDRLEDIGPLAQACLRDTARTNAGAMHKLSEDALALLRRHAWNGNVRELRQCLEQAAVLCEEPVISSRDLRLDATIAEASDARSRIPISPDRAGDTAVLAVLRQQGFDMQATAKALGWDRSTVTQRLKGLCFQALVESNGDKAQAAAQLAGDPSLTRTVELKLLDYYDHLMETIQPFAGAEEALIDCKRRFKNLPERHFRFVESLVRHHYRHATPPLRIST